MGDDHIRGKALLLELLRSPKTRFAPNRLGFKIGDPGMNIGRGAALGPIRQHLHPLPRAGRVFLHGQRHHGVALLRQRRGKKLELARKILVDE